MAPVTVAQRFGLKPEELNALTLGAGLEGYRGPGSIDPAAVAASILQRRVSGKYGGRDIRNILTAPGQYAAILDRGINMSQLADPAYGAKLLGGQSEFNRIQSMINDPEILRTQMSRVGTGFRSAATPIQKGDYSLIPGKTNVFLKEDINPNLQKQSLAALGPSTPQASLEVKPPTDVPPTDVLGTLTSALGFNPLEKEQDNRSATQKFLDQYKNQLMTNLLAPSFTPFQSPFGSYPTFSMGVE